MARKKFTDTGYKVRSDRDQRLYLSVLREKRERAAQIGDEGRYLRLTDELRRMGLEKPRE